MAEQKKPVLTNIVEHKIGEVVTLSNGGKAEVVLGGECSECALYHDAELCKKVCCDSTFRSDDTTIIYQEIQ